MDRDTFGSVSLTPRPVAPAVRVERIPQQLRERPRWLLWRYLERDGRWTKVPFRADQPGVRAKPNDPATAVGFDVALAAYRNPSFRADGLGFLFGEGDRACGVDLDGCLESDGSLRPWARERSSTCFPGVTGRSRPAAGG